VLRGIAQHKIPLSQADQWLKHFSSCSPCFEDFQKFRTEAVRKGRRLQIALAAAAVILFIIGGLFWIRTRQPLEAQTVTVDLRSRSVARGDNPSDTGQAPLQLSRQTRHLVLELPVGSKEGSYEVALLGGSGEVVRSTTGLAQFENHIVILRADLNLPGITPGAYLLGIRQPGLEWTNYPVRVR
jgi:hypothetical protein